MSWLHGVHRKSKRLVVLMGNHEAALLDSMEGDGRSQEMWLEHGGLATLACYGIAPPQSGESSESFAERLQQGIPAYLSNWLRELPLTFSSGSYFFCHAGVRPGIRLSRQRAQDLLGIRSDFLESNSSFGAVIVHGHSICETVEFFHNRINVDTGAFSSGVLSAVGLQDTEQWVLSTAASN
jgi:serine/threonine protein phosphatase 1